MDGDGDPDVLAASPSNGELTWYENTDGNGGFSEARTLAADITGANTVLATDLDSDGDSDILFAGDNTVTWYENLAISADVDPSDPNDNGNGQMDNGNGQMEILGSNPTAGQTSPWQMDGTDLMQGSSTAAMAEAITPVIA